MPPDNCPFLGLPTELRLLVYGFAILESENITIGTAELVGKKADIVYRQYADGRAPLEGIPTHHEPVITPTYKSSLLSLTNPATIPLTSRTSLSPPDQSNKSYSTYLNILLLNKQIREELAGHFSLPKNRTTNLFLSFPHGLHIMRTTTPHLIRQARSVHIAGTFKSWRAGHPDYQRSAAWYSRRDNVYPQARPPDPNPTPEPTVMYSQLGALVQAIRGPNPTHPVEKLELRIYYPGEGSYSTVWNDDSSPIVIALKSIAYGDIAIKVWRGRYGCGVHLTAKPPPELIEGARTRRIVSTIWRRLEEGRKGQPECGSWVIDPAWPEGEGAMEEDGDMKW